MSALCEDWDRDQNEANILNFLTGIILQYHLPHIHCPARKRWYWAAPSRQVPQRAAGRPARPDLTATPVRRRVHSIPTKLNAFAHAHSHVTRTRSMSTSVSQGRHGRRSRSTSVTTRATPVTAGCARPDPFPPPQARPPSDQLERGQRGGEGKSGGL